MAERAPQLIITNPPNESGGTAQACQTGHGVGGGPTRGFQFRFQGVVERFYLAMVQEDRAAFGQAMALQHLLRHPHQHINDGMANGHHVVALVGTGHHHGGGQWLSRPRLGP